MPPAKPQFLSFGANIFLIIGERIFVEWFWLMTALSIHYLRAGDNNLHITIDLRQLPGIVVSSICTYYLGLLIQNFFSLFKLSGQLVNIRAMANGFRRHEQAMFTIGYDLSFVNRISNKKRRLCFSFCIGFCVGLGGVVFFWGLGDFGYIRACGSLRWGFGRNCPKAYRTLVW